MPSSTFSSFPAEALEANRRGELSESQRRGFGALSGSNRRGALGSAGLLIAGALVVLFFASPTASPMLRMLVPLAALAIAAFLVVRSLTGADALTRDVAAGRVESIEGAIGKRRFNTGANIYETRLLDVAGRTFKVSPRTYAAAPDAGMVRLYFLPRSRKVVNLERLANAPMPSDLSPKGLGDVLGTALGAPTRREQNEARARIASLEDAVKTAFAPSPAAHTTARDPRPLAEAILGTWSNGFITATFTADGAVTTRMFQGEMRGRWSVDAGGRLHADLAGREQTAEAWVAGDQLTISADGEELSFTREGGA